MSSTAYTYQAPGLSIQHTNSLNCVGSTNRVSSPIWTMEVSDEQSRDIDTASDELIVGWSLLQMYGPQMVKSENLQSVMSRRTLPERLASTLLDLAEDHGRCN